MRPRIIRYDLPGNWMVLVGGSDVDNDYLSTVVASPGDWWFHAAGVPGSHVILRAKPDVEPTRLTLEQAASIAAYHSKARRATVVSVHWTHARNVSKARGAEAGTVTISKGNKIKVRPVIDLTWRVSGGFDTSRDNMS